MSVSLREATICLFLITFHQVSSQDISIIRGEKDIFTNITGCEASKAACLGKNCTHCQCKNEGETFFRRSNGSSECIPNECLADMTSPVVTCEAFEDDTFLVILNKTAKCQDEGLEEKEINVDHKNITECSLLPDQTQYLHKEKWKTLLVRKDSASLGVAMTDNEVFLKWNLTETPKTWEGLIVKAQFQCKSDGGQKKQSFCVLIKYAGLFTGFENDGENGSRGEEDNFETIAVVISLLVIAVVIGVLILLACRNRTRLITFIERNAAKYETRNESRNNPSGPTSAVSNNPIYHVSDVRSAQRNCELYETAGTEPVYQYAYAGYANKAKPPPNDTDPYYATPDEDNRKDEQKENVVSQNATEPQNILESQPVYHVLEHNNYS